MHSGANVFLTGEPGAGNSLDGLYLIGLGPQALQMDRDIYQFDKALKQGRSS